MLRVFPSAVVFALIAVQSGICQEPTADVPAKDAKSQPVDFARDIQPILAERCHACHGEDAQEGRLRLDARAMMFHGGISGPAVVKGESAASLLLKRLVTEDEQERMPLDDDPLSEAEIQLFRAWIDLGAPWPAGIGADVAPPATHWAYTPPTRPAIPDVENKSWITSPIDAFVLNRLEEHGLEPSPPARKERRIRRLYLDLVGLPPSVEEVDQFMSDTSPNAYERLVDRLLASPQYGIRWARPWLDSARYADSNGYQADQYRNVWPYRDWVITSMNADMPFDQFTLEQIAGDLLPESTIDQKIATGFHRLTTCNVEAGVDPEENRVNQLIDRVNTTGTVWLGTSIECAQCHNHKYDPFSQRDYYQLFAYFNNTPMEVEGNGVTYNFVGPKMDLPLGRDQQETRDALVARQAALEEKLESRVSQTLEGLPEWWAGLGEGSEPPKWHVMDIVSFESSGGSSHQVLDDGSILVGGKTPSKDNYTVVAKTDVSGITGFKLETLTDPSLPGNGPGRHHADRPNFVLYEFGVASLGEGGAATPVSLHGAQADFSQKNWHVRGAIDGDVSTGWAINPQFGKPHFATFLTSTPIESNQEAQFQFTFDQHYGDGRTIGRLRLSAMTGKPAPSDLPESIAAVIGRPESKWTKKQRKLIQDYFVGLDADVKKLRSQIASIKKKVDGIKPITTLVMVERDEARMTTVFKRGNFLDKGDPVEVGTPRALPSSVDELPDDRRGLAQWLTDSSNPLTARVAVNRWWAEFFGRGIVETIEDFGTQGERPTHPDLLDWLAVEFMESAWSMKRVHKAIVMSSTYQQSARASDRLLQRDPYNKLYARGPRFRLPAETIRDNALAVSGLLSRDLAGPPVYPPQPDGVWRHVGRNAPKYATSQGNDRFRRGIYVVWRRSAPYPSFTNFDAPDRASCVVKRPRTNTPLQALTLLNDQAYVEMAVALAERIVHESPSLTPESRVQYAFKLCTSRTPTDFEVGLLAEMYRDERERYEEDLDAAKILIPNGSDDERRELAAWFHVANVLLNLDETISK